MDLRNLQKEWDAWGKLDPYWAILSLPGKEYDRWDIEEFFKTGDDEVNNILAYVRSLGVDVSHARAMDFGCGAGRLTQALSKHFESVCGVDIAPSMIKLANKHNRAGARCQFILNQRDDLSTFKTESFDFIYSCRVLQHMEPDYCRSYVREFLRLLSPEGVLVFQEPAKKLDLVTEEFKPPEGGPLKRKVKSLVPKYILDIYFKLKVGYLKKHADYKPRMEMHCITPEEMTMFLKGLGAQIIDISEDDSASDFLSYRYCVKKL
jgi:ubiquinone/menaquinone biosynthesis C-methylase UbiE